MNLALMEGMWEEANAVGVVRKGKQKNQRSATRRAFFDSVAQHCPAGHG
jgi:hypothetical protein